MPALALLALAALSGLAQLYVVNRSLALYPQLVVVPVNSSLMLFLVTTVGGGFLGEAASLASAGVFAAALGLLCLGVFLFSYRQPMEDGEGPQTYELAELGPA